MKKLPVQQSFSEGLSLLNRDREPHVPRSWEYLKDSLRQRSLDTGNSAGQPPSVSSFINGFVHPEETELEEDASMAKSSAANPGSGHEPAQEIPKENLSQYILPPRVAATRATAAMAKTQENHPSLVNKTSKKRKVSDVSYTSKKNNALPLSTACKVSSGRTNNVRVTTSASKLQAPFTKKSHDVESTIDAKSPARMQKGSAKVQVPHHCRLMSATPSPSSETSSLSDLSSSPNEEEAGILDSEYGNSEGKAVTLVKKHHTRGSIATKPGVMTLPKWKTSPSKGRMIRIPAVQDTKHVGSGTNSISLTPARVLRSDARTSTSTPSQVERPWRVKDVTKYNSAQIDRLLARDPPKDPLELISHETLRGEAEMQIQDRADFGEDSEFRIFNAPLLAGTTQDERIMVDTEAGLRGKHYEFRYLGTDQDLPSQYEGIPTDLILKFNQNMLSYRVPASRQPMFELDPPGSNKEFDALKFPNRMLLKLNEKRTAFPAGWNEEALKFIPSDYIMYIHKDLRAKLPYSALRERDNLDVIIKSLPDDAVFFDGWEEDNEARIIESLCRKVKGTRLHSDDGLLDLAFAASEAARLPNSTRASGIDPPTDFRIESCKTCAIHGNVCDGVKPVCDCCMNKGRTCDFSRPEIVKIKDDVVEVQESYMRCGSELTGFDALLLAADILESGKAARLQESTTIADPQGTIHGHGSHLFSQESGFALHIIDLEEEGTDTYMVLSSQEESFYTRPSIRINVPDHLKNLLVDDWENITKSLQLVPLPSKAPANFIIDEYFNEEKMNRRLGSPEADILEEFCAGLKMYFEKAVGKILLYRFERGQLADVGSHHASSRFQAPGLDSLLFQVRQYWESGKYKAWDGKGPGDCYGAEHLTRMIVNLPEMIAQTNMDVEAVSRLKTELSKFSTWLSRNSKRFFCAKYEKAGGDYVEAAR